MRKFTKTPPHTYIKAYHMFKKRIKKNFPEGTFIPTFPRILSIIQLCLAFTAFLFAAGSPFLTHHFDIKSKILLYDYVLGNTIHTTKAHFNELDEHQKNRVMAGYEELNKAASTSFFKKLEQSLNLILIKISAFERAWILFAIVIPILLLKKVEGAKQAVWILPLIALAYLCNNQTLESPISNEEAMLYPEEDWLSMEYLGKNINEFPIQDQQGQLLKAWHYYLIDFYTKEQPSSDPEIFQNQKVKGEFRFHLARIEKLKGLEESEGFALKKQPFFLMFIYCIWNIFFAMVTSEIFIFKKIKLFVRPIC